ncbi:LOW QUALITY PROTEIN: uncharacterized protein LOC117177941 [Belonocnema kinseyi]|uniref:LOW QUALITY PROTEIN: uncharacterized protein LOC117177941 n=1 Tax=Belonocnema kinseyi TaxID=2817044 RepID=UPI00143DC562|nr:LOW QUALITY PROTEIN: uncharacterized protein LOC117177941 [Belonocnema kinseyi]
MCPLKSVIITLPKGLKKDSGIISTNDLRSATKLNFATSILTDKLRIDNRKTVKHMEDTMIDSGILKPEPICIRGKKRRLDHLTWEEKLQRKKLKNRVAAQTSRDRKKAKLDELEETVRMLAERNDLLVQECTMLRSENESLHDETERLKTERHSETTKERLCSMCQGRVDFTVPSSGSAESHLNPPAGWGSSVDTTSDTDTKCRRPSEDSDALPPLEELFGELQGDDYIDRLEELAESLLREVTAEVEANTTRPNEQVSVKKETAGESPLVGQAPNVVEVNAGSRSISAVEQSALVPTSCISEVPPDLVPAENSHHQDVKIKREPASDVDTVYGTYDEATNCITIIVNDDIKIQESVQEISSEGIQNQIDEPMPLTPVHYTDTDHLSPYASHDSMSPSSIHSDDTDSSVPINKQDSNFSDTGYESHGSPFDETCSVNETSVLTDLWHESFSELFPSLA